MKKLILGVVVSFILGNASFAADCPVHDGVDHFGNQSILSKQSRMEADQSFSVFSSSVKGRRLQSAEDLVTEIDYSEMEKFDIKAFEKEVKSK